MTIYQQLASELSLIKSLHLDLPFLASLPYCQFEIKTSGPSYEPSPDDHFLYDLIQKIVKRGSFPFPSFSLEKNIIDLYGSPFSISIKEKGSRGAIDFSYNKDLIYHLESFKDLYNSFSGSASDLSFDPKNPQNERRFFSKLIGFFSPKIANLIQMQVNIPDILPESKAKNFLSQRIDFLLTLPNGKSLVIEPGDHITAAEMANDKIRDKAFSDYAIPTLRFSNAEIVTQKPYLKVKDFLTQNHALDFISPESIDNDELSICLSHLLLLPSLVVRLLSLLSYFFFRQGLFNQSSIKIGVIEQDLESAVLSITDFKELVVRLGQLYEIPVNFPEITLFVIKNSAFSFADFSKFDIQPIYVGSFAGLDLDLILDVSIRSNPSNFPVDEGAPFIGSVRQSFIHNSPVEFRYLSKPRAISITDKTDGLIESFLRDFFRKWSLREGQLPIIKNILLQKHTIGLLPTSAGKSICYQLAALLSPGTTFIIDPIVSLMMNQAQTLRDYYGIDRAFAWSGLSASHQSASSLLSGYVMVFISPERLLRDSFRSAMVALKASDIFINFVVIDEAHCLSMWGHDFRPSYLMVESNVRRFCKIGGVSPPLIALTGTASQLVLIDLRRELLIDDLSSIIRPKSFDRKELNFNLISCKANDKVRLLPTVEKAIANRLNVTDLSRDAHGILFSAFPNELWSLLSSHLGDLSNHVSDVLKAGKWDTIPYGVYCGSTPAAFPSKHYRDWSSYKDKVLDLFQQGNINMLFGNTAISVGLDNPKINYIINYKMPQSLEAYYQQCGRAGREQQHSECYLLFSDDNPYLTKKWLDREIKVMPNRYDDLGTASYFHQDNFPGVDVEIKDASLVFSQLVKKPFDPVVIPADLDGIFNRDQAKRTEKYISYFFVLGLISDYEEEGMDSTSRFKVIIDDQVKEYFNKKDDQVLQDHIIEKLDIYLNRYQPATSEEIIKKLRSRKEPDFFLRSIAYLISFIYEKIEYQRREAIRTMVNFCNEKDTDPKKLRSRIVSYFDSSQKFSPILFKMETSKPSITPVIDIIKKVKDFNDGELLYYTTRRLLDERQRPDWLASNMYAYVFRENGRYSKEFANDLLDLQKQLTVDFNMDKNQVNKFLAGFLSQFILLDKIFSREIGVDLISNSILHLLNNFGRSFLPIVSLLKLPAEPLQQIELIISNHLLKELLNANYSRITR